MPQNQSEISRGVMPVDPLDDRGFAHRHIPKGPTKKALKKLSSLRPGKKRARIISYLNPPTAKRC